MDESVKNNASDRVWAIAGTAIAHALLAGWFYGSAAETPGAQTEAAALQVVYWVEASAPAAKAARLDELRADGGLQSQRAPVEPIVPDAPAVAPPRQRARSGSMERPPVAAEAGAATPGAKRELDLTLRQPVIFAPAPAPDASLPWDRTRTDSPPTRFDQAWAPTEKSIQHGWAFRSRIAGHLLGAVGALKEPCTRQERERMEDKCHGAQYRGDFQDQVDIREGH